MLKLQHSMPDHLQGKLLGLPKISHVICQLQELYYNGNHNNNQMLYSVHMNQFSSRYFRLYSTMCLIPAVHKSTNLIPQAWVPAACAQLPSLRPDISLRCRPRHHRHHLLMSAGAPPSCGPSCRLWCRRGAW